MSCTSTRLRTAYPRLKAGVMRARRREEGANTEHAEPLSRQKLTQSAEDERKTDGRPKTPTVGRSKLQPTQQHGRPRPRRKKGTRRKSQAGEAWDVERGRERKKYKSGLKGEKRREQTLQEKRVPRKRCTRAGRGGEETRGA